MPNDAAEERNAKLSMSGHVAEAIKQPRTAKILLLIGIVNVVKVTMVAATRWKLDDFNIHYTSAMALRQGIDPYLADLTPLSHRLGLTVDVMNRAADTPFFLVAFEPFTILPPQLAYWTWFLLSAALLAATVRLLLRRTVSLSPAERYSLWALVLLYVPLAENFYFSQSQVIILFLLTLAIIRLESGRDEVAGAVLGIAALLRAYPLVLAGYLVARRQWRALAAMSVTIAIGAGLTLAIAGSSFSLAFLTHDPAWLVQPAFTGNWFNVSIEAFLTRLPYLVLSPGRIDFGVAAARVIAPATRVGLIALAVWVTARRAARSDPDFRCFSLWVTTAILVSPIAWFHYMTLLILPFLLLVGAASAGRATSRACWMAGASYSLSALATGIYHSMHFKTLLTGNSKPPYNVAFAPGPVYFMLVAEWSFFAMLAAYVAVFWFVTDPFPQTFERRDSALFRQ